MMKVLFTAVGSIGTRHVNNLWNACQNRGIDLAIDVIRRTDRILEPSLLSKIRREIRNERELDTYYDVVFITDITQTHYENILKYESICDHMFIEKPIFDKIEYPIEKIDVLAKGNSVYYVACPIRFTKYVKALKHHVAQHEVFSARIIFSSYMPSWQANRDYTKSFRCFAERGGGVDVDLLHEIDYMVELFGLPHKVHRVAGKYSNLKMDACDLATYIFEYSNKIVEMHLDYFGRVRNRKTELYVNDDVITVDFNQGSSSFGLANQIDFYGKDNHFYEDEMAYFLDLILSNGKLKNINPPKLAFKILELSKGIY